MKNQQETRQGGEVVQRQELWVFPATRVAAVVGLVLGAGVLFETHRIDFAAATVAGITSIPSGISLFDAIESRRW